MLAMQHYVLPLCMCMCRGITESLISGNRPGREQGCEQEGGCVCVRIGRRGVSKQEKNRGIRKGMEDSL